MKSTTEPNIIEGQKPRLSEAKKELLARRLHAGNQPAERRSSIPVRKQSRAPLSFAQERLWFLDQLQPRSPLYSIPLAFRVDGKLNRAALEESLKRIIRRHEILRTRFVADRGEPVQVVDESIRFELSVMRVSGNSSAEKGAQLRKLIAAEARRPFVLSKDLMLRATLFEVSKNSHGLLVNMHHIASDGWSCGVFLRELASFYNALSTRREISLPAPRIQYGDFTVWEREQLENGKLKEELAYWRKRLENMPALLELPADHPRPVAQTFHGDRVTLALRRELLDKLNELTRREGVTLYQLLLAAYNVLLYRHTQREDMVVGTPSAGRSEVDTEGLIGFFVKTLVVRTDLSGQPTFREALQRVKQVMLDSDAHQDAPFEKLVEELRPARSPAFAPLVQVMFAYQNAAALDLKLDGLAVSALEVPMDTAKFDLTLFLEETTSDFRAVAEYNSDLFERATIERMLLHFEVLLRGIVDEPDRRISELPLLAPEERTQLLVEWNKTGYRYPRDKSLSQLFEEQVARTPDAIAVEFQNERLSYRELNERANQLAHRLQALGVGPDVLVAVALERSLELIVAVTAIIKAGGGYVALDPSYPQERLMFMLDDSAAPVWLTNEHLWKKLGSRNGTLKVVCLDREERSLGRESKTNPANASGAENLAYVSFTSGSTGGPKGVCIPHRAVARLVLNTNYLQLGQNDAVAQVSNCAFDASTFEIWGALLNGAKLVVIPQSIVLAPKKFGQELRDRGVTAMFVTTAMFNQLSRDEPEVFESLRHLLFGGDAVNPGCVAEVLRNGKPGRLLHVYGPTEATTFATWHEVREVTDGNTVPIGRPIANTDVYILDGNRQPVPVGVPGELYIGGDGLARGYLNRPELTAEKFVSHPFSPDPTARLYRTGDIVRYRSDGNIEFIGRVDSQIKLRGFRIELGEIESILGAHPDVREVVVTVAANASGEKRLIAFLVAKGTSALTEVALRNLLRAKLPEYMVPAAFVFLPALPLNPNGKVDRAALPVPDETRVAAREYVAPRDATEHQLAAIWEELLSVRPIGLSDNFFDLGGHSLLAVRMLARTEKCFGKSLPVTALFRSPTLGEFAASVREAGAVQVREGSSLIPIQPEGNLPPLFLVHGAGGGMFWGYTNLACHLGKQQPVYAFKSRALEGLPEFRTIEEMAACYVTDLKQVQPDGPYHLGGYCFGGNVAYEMARQLRAGGDEVALLALFNSMPPQSSYARVTLTGEWLRKFLANLGYLLRWHFHRTSAQRSEFLKWQTRSLVRRCARRLGIMKQSNRISASEFIDLSMASAAERPVWDAHVQALAVHRTKPYVGRVTLLRSEGHQFWCSFDDAYGWKEFITSGLEVRVISGAHEQILEEPHVRTLAANLRQCLNDAQQSGKCNPTGATPDTRLSGLHVLTDAEGRELTIDWNGPRLTYPKDATLANLFEAQAARTPEEIALVHHDMRLSYRELNERANKLAHHLRALGVGPEVLVALCLERSWRMVVGILGVLKAGGAYVPMDPAYPKERLRFMLEDAQSPVVVTEATQCDLFQTGSQPAPKLVCLDVDWDRISAESSANLETHSESNNLAYVIYTSGSTGKPKGVAIEHRSAVALMYWAREIFSREEISGTLAATSICFDLSIFELFVPLSWGGKIILADNAIALASLPAAKEVTLINTVPSAMRELLRVKGVLHSVRVVNLAGEPLSTALVDQIYRETSAQKVYDLYGPTETTTYSTGSLRQAGAPATIGKPLANERVYILDERMQLVPIGVAGELYIGGDGLAREYLHRSDLTAQRFVPDPFQAGSRIYKTGDLARWRMDGKLEYLGRLDHQVKIRGFRIELGEVEAALASHPRVAEGVVVARETASGDKRLVGYAVARDGQRPSANNLRQFLKERLPAHAVPSDVVFLNELPLTPNGKVDRKALPEVTQTRASSSHEFVAPRTAMETALCEIWREVLGLPEVGVQDNFFELGGHSLLAIQVISQVRARLNVELPLFSLFDAPTIAALAQGMTAGRWPQSSTIPLQRISRDKPLPVSFVQERLWFIDQLDPGSHAYNVPIAIRLRGRLDKQAWQRAMNEIAARHEAFRTVFSFLEGNLRQIIAAPSSFPVEQIDLQHLPIGKREAQANERVARMAQRPFDLARGPLTRAILIQLDAEDHIFALVMHHSVSDGWALSIFFKELETFYRAFTAGLPAPELPALLVQSADAAYWQRESMRGEAVVKELTYWQDTLKGAPSSVALPTDRQSESIPSSEASRCDIQFSESVTDSLNQLCRREGCTPFMVFLTALGITLRQWTKQRDLVLGTVVAGRNRRELENVIGCFMTFLPLRLKITGNETGQTFLAQTRSTVLDAQAHQDCPFQKIVEVVNPERRMDQNPLYNVALLLQNFPNQVFEADDLKSEILPVEMKAALLDLRFEAEESESRWRLMCEYKTCLFTAETIRELLASFEQVLQTLVKQPETRTSDFKITAGLEGQAQAAKASALTELVAVTATFTADFVADTFRHWVKELELPATMEFAPYGQVFQQLLDPNSLLATNQKGLNVVLARLEDWRQTAEEKENALALADESQIERSARELVAAVKTAAGRSAAPHLICLCPSSRTISKKPEQAELFQRMEQLIARELRQVSGVHLVTYQELFELYPVPDHYDPAADELGQVPYSMEFFAALATMIARRYHALKRAPHKVVVLDCDHTLWSGVCGEDGPEGVQLDPPRRALQEFMRAQLESGRLLCVCSKNNEEDVLATFDKRPEMPLQKNHFAATRINWQPKSANIRALAQELNLGLNSFVLVDDNPMECAEVSANCPEVVALQLPEQPELIPQFLKHCWLFDSFKTTEEDRNRTEFYQQNRQREELRQESPSLADFLKALELRVQINELAPHHVSRVAQLTQRTNQFNTTTRRRTESELLQFCQHHGGKVFVVSVTDRFGDYGLVGAMFAEIEGSRLKVDNLLLSCRVLGKGVEHQMLAHLGRFALKRRLTTVAVHFASSAKNKPARDFLESTAREYKHGSNGGFVFNIPAHVAEETAFRPTNISSKESAISSGSNTGAKPVAASVVSKFDRWRWIALEANDASKILERVRAKTTKRSRQTTSDGPRNEIEKQLLRIWQDLLGIDGVGIHDDFFALGGHSLLAVRLFAQIEKLTGKRLPVVTIFQSPTIVQLAERIASSESAPPVPSLIVPIQPQGTRPPLFLVHGAGGDVMWGYANLAQHLDREQPVYGIQARASDAPDAYATLEDMAANYIAELTAFYPSGPYCIGGYCFGGNLAYEMARQLTKQGKKVAFVGLIEATPEGGNYERACWRRADFVIKFVKNFYYCLGDFYGYTPEERRSLVQRKIKVSLRKLWKKISGAPAGEDVDLEDVIDATKFSDHEIKLWDAHLRLLQRHTSKTYDGHVTVYRTAAHPLFCSYEHDLFWGPLVKGGVTVKIVGGSHGNIFLEPHVRSLAQNLASSLVALSPNSEAVAVSK